MNALEARAKVEAALQSDINEQYIAIYSAIDKAVEEKKFEITWNEELYPYVKSCLVNDHYKIGAGLYHSHRNEQEYSITIKW